MGQGAESQVGDLSSLQAKRNAEPTQETTDSVEVTFDPTRNTPAILLLVINQDEQLLNQLLYDIALFNFSQFMIKDFDLKQEFLFAKDQSAVIVSGFEKMDEAEWYHNLLTKNTEISQKLVANNAQVISITQTNFEILIQHFTLTDYLEWLTQIGH